jgi:NTP pyrophosphatase (non-canonical NTP hydrolase)
MKEIRLCIHPFEMGVEKEAALKPLEEASEVHGAWQMLGETNQGDFARVAKMGILKLEDDMRLSRLADEIADVIQAACNLAARYDINLDSAMKRCTERNLARGRYADRRVAGDA